MAAAKLLSLFEGFANQRYLYAAPQNPNVLFYLLETFNNLIQYQLQGTITTSQRVHERQVRPLAYRRPHITSFSAFFSSLGNTQLVYAILRHRAVFERLAALAAVSDSM